MGLRPIREADVLSACLSLFTIHGWLHWRNNTGQLKIAGRVIRFGRVGSSDILAVVPRSGRIMACECKRPGKAPTENQEAFLESVERNGGVSVVVSDVVKLEETLRTLEMDPWREFRAYKQRGIYE